MPVASPPRESYHTLNMLENSFCMCQKEFVNNKESNDFKINIKPVKMLASKSPTKHLSGSKFTNSLFFSTSKLPLKSPGDMKGWKTLLAFP